MDSVAFLPDGTQVIAEGEAQDIVRRVRDGDPTKGWEGDPTMRVFAQPYQGSISGEVRYFFEVWGLDAHNEPYLACVSETCGPELVEKLVAGDTRKRDVFGDIMARQAKYEADKAAERSEFHGEMAERLGFALLSDNAAHFGGKGRHMPVTKPGG